MYACTAVGLLAAAAVSVTAGQYELPLAQLGPILAGGPHNATDLDASVVWQIRLPRLVLGLIVGAALGVGGALMQAVFANPLAEPSVIGVSSGAGVGAAAAIVFGWNVVGAMTTPLCAFAAGLATTALVYQLSRIGGSVRVINLILVGIAANALAGATIALLTFIAPTTARENIIFWQMGTLAGATWEHTGIVAVIAAIALGGALLLGRRLDILALGDTAAFHVGINVTALRVTAIALSTLLTAAAVSFAGLIGFVGLVVPHIVRTVMGPSNAALLPASALGGALLIAVGDVLARTLIAFADLPIGIFTAMIGGPVFFVLLRRMMRKGGIA
ncbi:FecCD family ABC transporter permease [Corynebacterium timonense]|uniref:Iron complex transport system permease protein n=1 Tax=Corynebacterium timonense TaxID=441500 RepID=A0A1H1QW49_9CORY|nr:iron ABC transporter permease [Corynebacterium timonense]SDS27607.1 iron complex transport system permease protein [Corynebacterium timonense]